MVSTAATAKTIVFSRYIRQNAITKITPVDTCSVDTCSAYCMCTTALEARVSLIDFRGAATCFSVWAGKTSIPEHDDDLENQPRSLTYSPQYFGPTFSPPSGLTLSTGSERSFLVACVSPERGSDNELHLRVFRGHHGVLETDRANEGLRRDLAKFFGALFPFPASPPFFCGVVFGHIYSTVASSLTDCLSVSIELSTPLTSHVRISSKKNLGSSQAYRGRPLTGTAREHPQSQLVI